MNVRRFSQDTRKLSNNTSQTFEFVVLVGNLERRDHMVGLLWQFSMRGLNSRNFELSFRWKTFCGDLLVFERLGNGFGVVMKYLSYVYVAELHNVACRGEYSVVYEDGDDQ